MRPAELFYFIQVWGFESLIICGVAGLLRIIERNEDMQKISAGTAA